MLGARGRQVRSWRRLLGTHVSPLSQIVARRIDSPGCANNYGDMRSNAFDRR